jgi:hypothetical protein
MVPPATFRVQGGSHPTPNAAGKRNPEHLQVTASLFLWCGNPARIGRNTSTARGGKGDLTYRVNTMETVNAATLPHQHENQFLIQHIVCQAAFNTTYTHNSHSGKTYAFSLKSDANKFPTYWFYMQTQRVGRLYADWLEPQHMEKAP